MGYRWFPLIMGVALLQGSLSFSPIPEMKTLEEEWAEFAARVGNPEYRLPTTTVPRHYEVTLNPYLDIVPTPGITPFTFDGSVVIYITPTNNFVNEVVLHCNDLTIQTTSLTYTTATGTTGIVLLSGDQTCDPTYDFLRMRTEQYLTEGVEYTLSITFIGNLQTNMRGFYRSWYRDSQGLRWMGTTQFQPGHARQAFPCYDEPGFKATFDISITRAVDFSPTISNMPIRNTSEVVNGRVTETFHTTPKTSTYLLAFIVSHYQVVSSNNNATRSFDIYARNNIGNDGDWSLEVGEKLLEAMEEYTQIPYFEMADYMNMKQAAIPDFSAGAMENWGLLTYREALLLFDPLKTNNFYKQRVANIVSHEIAHMWFGNLVTCAWWDNLWLNEGFARFYQYFLTGSVEPELGFDIRFIVEQVHVAMLSDSLDTAHPLTDPSVTDPTSVSNHFSTITYARGAAVLRMTQYLLGVDTYVKGLRNYLAARSYDVAEPHHLFNALDAAAAEDSAFPPEYNGITIEEYFKTWSEKAGHPLLTVRIDQTTGIMTVTQSRWERNTGTSTDPSFYHIPLTWTRENDADFDNLKPSMIITSQITTLDRGSTGLEWVIFNKQQSGFYRVLYDDTNYALLTRALRSDERTEIHEFNRAQIVDDLFAFGRASVLPYQRMLNILSFLVYEDAYAPWLAAISGFEFLIRRVAHSDDATAKLKELIVDNSDAVVNRLGFVEPDNELYMPGLQRMYVSSFLCTMGHEGCNAAAVTNFQAWRNGGYIKPNLRPWVYCGGLRAGNAEDFDFYWNQYLTEDHASEQVVMIQNAGCTLNEASLGRYWEAITDGQETIRPQDISAAISSAITSNEQNTLRSFDWIRANLDRTRNTIGLATPLNSIISRLLNEEQISVVSAWVEENQEVLGTSVYNTCINAIATSRANINWYNSRAAELNSFFETGYQEDDLTDPTEAPTTTEPTTLAPESEEEEDENDDGSANIAAISLVTLIVTLSINFLA